MAVTIEFYVLLCQMTFILFIISVLYSKGLGTIITSVLSVILSFMVSKMALNGSVTGLQELNVYYFWLLVAIFSFVVTGIQIKDYITINLKPQEELTYEVS